MFIALAICCSVSPISDAMRRSTSAMNSGVSSTCWMCTSTAPLTSFSFASMAFAAARSFSPLRPFTCTSIAVMVPKSSVWVMMSEGWK